MYEGSNWLLLWDALDQMITPAVVYHTLEHERFSK